MADMAEEKNNLDVCGLQVTCASDEALELFNSACFSYITVRQRCTAELSRALQLDDSMVMGHCLLVIITISLWVAPCNYAPPAGVPSPWRPQGTQ